MVGNVWTLHAATDQTARVIPSEPVEIQSRFKTQVQVGLRPVNLEDQLTKRNIDRKESKDVEAVAARILSLEPSTICLEQEEFEDQSSKESAIQVIEKSKKFHQENAELHGVFQRHPGVSPFRIATSTKT